MKRLRCKPLKQDERSREANQDHLDDQVYKLHILRAMAKYVVLRIPALVCILLFFQTLLHNGLLLHSRRTAAE